MKTLIIAIFAIFLVGCNNSTEVSVEETAVAEYIKLVNLHANEMQQEESNGNLKQALYGVRAAKTIERCTNGQSKTLTVSDVNKSCYMNLIAYSARDSRFEDNSSHAKALKEFAKNATYNFVVANNA